MVKNILNRNVNNGGFCGRICPLNWSEMLFRELRRGRAIGLPRRVRIYIRNCLFNRSQVVGRSPSKESPQKLGQKNRVYAFSGRLSTKSQHKKNLAWRNCNAGRWINAGRRSNACMRFHWQTDGAVWQWTGKQDARNGQKCSRSYGRQPCSDTTCW